MKLAATYMSIFALSGTLSVASADDLPTKSNFDRYKGMLDHSPFAVATAVIAAPAAPNTCKDLYIANAARSADGDSVTLMSSADKEFKKYLNSKEGAVDGYAIANIEWSDRVGETKVTISKDGQFCALTFNQAVLSQPMPNKPGMPAPGVMPQPQQPSYKPFQPSAVPAPTPHVRSTIQRNPQQPNSAQVKTPPPSSVDE
jgi:hypothetical protein